MKFSTTGRWNHYLVALAATLSALVLSLWLDVFLTQAIATFFYLAAVVSTWYGGRRPGFFSVAISAVLLERFLIYNHQYWWWQDIGAVSRLLTFTVTAVVMTLLTDNLHRSREQLRVNRDRIVALDRQIIDQAEDDLAKVKALERRWRNLFDNVQMFVVGMDLDGNIEYANTYFFQRTGYTPTTVIGCNALDLLLRPQDVPQIRRELQKLVAQGLPYSYQCAVLTSTGEELATAWNTILLPESTENSGVITIGQDITQRQALEKTKNEFISVLSHELRTPLTGVCGSLGLLASGIYDDHPEKSRRMLQLACEQSDRLMRLINDILDLERLTSDRSNLPSESCAVQDLIQKSVATLRCSAEQAQVKIILGKIDPTNLQVWAIPDAIIQTLTNLLSNAIKFSAPQSSVQVDARIAAPNVLFSVQDQGRGIPADKLEVIFDRFQQVDSSDTRQKSGTGLGLAICREIIRQHGGQIWVESQIDRGSTFYFTLPTAVSIVHGVQANFSNWRRSGNPRSHSMLLRRSRRLASLAG